MSYAPRHAAPRHAAPRRRPAALRAFTTAVPSTQVRRGSAGLAVTAVLAGGVAFAGLGGSNDADATPDRGPQTAPGSTGTAVSVPQPSPTRLALISATSGSSQPTPGPSADYQPKHRADVPADSVGSTAANGARTGETAEATPGEGSSASPTASPSGSASGSSNDSAGASSAPEGSGEQGGQESAPEEEPTPSGGETPEDDGSGGLLEDVTDVLPGLDELPSALPSAPPTALPSDPSGLLP